MKKKIYSNIYGALIPALFMMLGACSRPVVVVEDIPENTPPGSRLFITGDFNRWDPGDQNFVLQMDHDSNYFIEMPNGFGVLHFKMTRGDWTTVETDVCGYDIENRQIFYGDEDTLFVRIESWHDLEALNCPEVTIVINKLPLDTPEDEPIAIAGEFNEWSPDSSHYMKRDTLQGKYVFTMPRLNQSRSMEFLVTRGDLRKAEADKYGNLLKKRKILFGLEDTIFIEVENWEDMTPAEPDKLTVILDKIPDEEPGDKYFITGNFNGWYPRDYQYQLRKNAKGKYQIKVPYEGEDILFKITRGDWSTEEVDQLGYKMNNHEIKRHTTDTVMLTIHGWLDRTSVRRPVYTFVIDSLPTGTPPDARIYMAASVNGWNPSSLKFRFRKNENGKYYLTLMDAWLSFEYKLTMGNWRTEEVDAVGNIISNRKFKYSGQDTIHLQVKNWIHIPPLRQESVVLVIDSLPIYTPVSQDIYIAGNFNNWNPGHKNFILDRNSDGLYFIRIPEWDDEIHFKFTLGSWDFEEQNAENENINNRMYRFGYVDTLRLQVENWKGL